MYQIVLSHNLWPKNLSFLLSNWYIRSHTFFNICFHGERANEKLLYKSHLLHKDKYFRIMMALYTDVQHHTPVWVKEWLIYIHEKFEHTKQILFVFSLIFHAGISALLVLTGWDSFTPKDVQSLLLMQVALVQPAPCCLFVEPQFCPSSLKYSQCKALLEQWKLKFI